MIAVIVATPLQMFNSIVIMRHFFPGDTMDLFVLDIACDMHECIERYRSLDEVGDVYFLDDVCKKKSRAGIVFDHIYTTKKQKGILRSIRTKTYQDMFTTYVTRPATWLYTKLIKRNPDMRLHFYEEGIGVYTRQLYESYNGIKRMYQLLGYRCEADYVEDMYVFQPALYRGTKLPLKKIGKVTGQDTEYIRGKSDFPVYPYARCILFLENAYDGTPMDGLDECQIIDEIISAVGKENVWIRLHPQSPKDKYRDKGYQIDRNSQVPWEDLIARNARIEQVLLVTVLSSAVFTPKMIYGKEPGIIVAGRAVSMEYPGAGWAAACWNREYEQFVEGVAGLYQDKAKIMIPDSYGAIGKIARGFL